MNSDFKNCKIALVHDWLTGMRGGEKVLEALCDLFPQSDIFTLIHNKGTVSHAIESHKIFTAFTNKLPFKRSKYRHFLPLFPTAIERFSFRDYQLIISTSHCVAKGIITPPDALHISYLHTPMRYVWDMYDAYFGKAETGIVSRMTVPFFANYLRMWDVSSSNRVDWFLANSSHVRRRIKKYYGRDATVIHPPADTASFKPNRAAGEDYYLIVSALVPYKKVDLAIKAFNQMSKPLMVLGNGPELNFLKKIAGPTIKFIGWQKPEKLTEYYQSAKALIFPGEEDFGIVPVEAMACGRPVIAFKKGGALETVIEHEADNKQHSTGVFFKEQTTEDLIKAVEKSEQINWNAEAIAGHARKFGTERFKMQISDFVSDKYSAFLKGK